LTDHRAFVRTLVLSPDNQRLFSGSTDKKIKEWDTQNGQCVRTLTGHSSWINSLVISKDGRKLFSASADQTIKEWDTRDGRCLRTLISDEPIQSIVMSKDY